MSEDERWRTTAFAVADLQKQVRELQEQMERAFLEIEKLRSIINQEKRSS